MVTTRTHHHEDLTSHPAGSNKRTKLVRGGIRYSAEEGPVNSAPKIIALPTRTSSQPPKYSAEMVAAAVGKEGPIKIKPLELPTEAYTRPPPYTTTFSSIFYLATTTCQTAATHGSGGGGASLLTVGTESIARIWGGGGPTSPGGWSAYSSSSTSSAQADGVGTGLSGVGGTAAAGGLSSFSSVAGGSSGPGWSTPLPPLAKAEQEEQIRKEALALLAVCAAYDTGRFVRDGWLTATMYAILCAWGIVRRGERGDKLSGREYDSLRPAELPVEKGDRSYLVRMLGELAYAMKGTDVGSFFFNSIYTQGYFLC